MAISADRPRPPPHLRRPRPRGAGRRRRAVRIGARRRRRRGAVRGPQPGQGTATRPGTRSSRSRKWSATHLTAGERAAATVYTSGEHCPMCSAAHAWMGLGRIVYAVSSATLSGWLAEWGPAGSGAAAADQRGGTRRTRRRAGAGARGRDEGAAPAALRLTQAGRASRSSKKSSTRSTPSCWRCSVRVGVALALELHGDEVVAELVAAGSRSGCRWPCRRRTAGRAPGSPRPHAAYHVEVGGGEAEVRAPSPADPRTAGSAAPPRGRPPTGRPSSPARSRR